jgi:hypothetical protein
MTDKKKREKSKIDSPDFSRGAGMRSKFGHPERFEFSFGGILIGLIPAIIVVIIILLNL